MDLDDDSCFEDDDSELDLLIRREGPPNGQSVKFTKSIPQRTLDMLGKGRGSEYGQGKRGHQGIGHQGKKEGNGLQGKKEGNGGSFATHHFYDANALQTYIYPTNLEQRDYQYNIVSRAFYHNVLAALPTGLGKTFIASTVMLNFMRWFPESKIIFMAPTRPLVAQQIKACCSVTGIPSEKVAILLDKVRRNRGEIWDTKKVFFTTPQVVENDLKTGIVDPKSIVLLVVDEAHRARGNYAYNNVVQFMKRFSQSFRVLALTATPAADVEGVQEIVSNLQISKMEVRTEKSIDIIRYMKRKKVERYNLGPSAEITELVDLLCSAIEPTLIVANERKLIDVRDPHRLNFFQCMEAQRRLTANKSIPPAIKWPGVHTLSLLGVVGQCLKRLNIYGIRSFYSYFSEKHAEFVAKNRKKPNKTGVSFFLSDSVQLCLEKAQEFMADESVVSHPKIAMIVTELTDFFIEHRSSSKVIIFTEFRESALEIVKEVQKNKGMKPHIFIGQSKEREKFEEKGKKGKKEKGKKGKEGKEGKEQSEEDSLDTSSLAQVTGMSQKLQKEIIRKFKDGVYNILVCTSIGEEGLDIGEVDLIICYDSTSSPIKNIQRMGRTGRKRDGKVVLLFSGNEEAKFDKAMGGYEYIQSYIMQSNAVEMAPQNRIIPREFEPRVERKLIEIPDDNADLKYESDDDEIIRIATQYMTRSQKKTPAKTQKREKRFFMPDNVETGFRSVSSMLSGDVSTEKSVLDSILDSSEEEKKSEEKNDKDGYIYEDAKEDKSFMDEGEKEKSFGGAKEDKSCMNEDGKEESSFKGAKNSSLNDDAKENSFMNEDVGKSSFINEGATKDKSSFKKNAGSSFEAGLPHDLQSNIPNSGPSKRNEKQMLGDDEMVLPEYAVASTPQKRQKQSPPLKQESSPQMQNQPPQMQNQPLQIQKQPPAIPSSPSNPSDVFDDGLDEELAMISSETRPSSVARPASGHSKELFKCTFGPKEGLLTEEEQMELYSSYYSGYDVPAKNQYDPSEGLDTVKKGVIGPSRKTQVLLNHRAYAEGLTREDAEELKKAAEDVSDDGSYARIVKEDKILTK